VFPYAAPDLKFIDILLNLFLAVGEGAVIAVGASWCSAFIPGVEAWLSVEEPVELGVW
jgi:hypothetical protein